MAEVSSGSEKKEDLIHYLKIAAAVISVAAVILLSWLGYRTGQEIFSDEPVTQSGVTGIAYELTVEKGDGALKIGIELQKNGVIRSGLAFFLQTRVYELKIEEGVYLVTSKQSSKEIARYLNQEYVRAHQEE